MLNEDIANIGFLGALLEATLAERIADLRSETYPKVVTWQK
jgi:hypothetical protein